MELRPHPLGRYSWLMLMHSYHKKICPSILFLFLSVIVGFFPSLILPSNLLSSLLLFVAHILQTLVKFGLSVPLKDLAILTSSLFW